MLENSVWQFSFPLAKLILKGNSCLQPDCELANFILQIFGQNNYANAGVKSVNPDRCSWWCTGYRYSCSSKTKFLVYFFYFWKWNYNSAYSAFCVYGQTDGFTYTEVGWSWFWFFLDIASTYSFIKRLLQEEVVENAEWLEHFTVVLGLLYCPFLQNCWKEEVSWLFKLALLHSLFAYIDIVGAFWLSISCSLQILSSLIRVSTF